VTSASTVPVCSGSQPICLNVHLQYASTLQLPSLSVPTTVSHRILYWGPCCSQRTWRRSVHWSVTRELTSTSMQTISTFTPAFHSVQPILHSWRCAPTVCSTGCGITGSSSTQTSLSLLWSEVVYILPDPAGRPTSLLSDHLKILGVTFDSWMTSDTQVTATVRACNFHLVLATPQEFFASWCCTERRRLVPSLNRGWITATLCITTCQTTIFKGYRECRMLPQELFEKLHDANITQMTILRISIGYRCATESTTRLPSCYKAIKLQQPSYLTGLLSSYRQSRVLRSSTSDLLSTLSTQSSLTNIAARQFSCCAPTVWNSLPSFVCTADSFTSFRSQLMT